MYLFLSLKNMEKTMYKIYGGTTIGANHIKTPNILLGQPNQDSYSICSSNKIQAVVGVICDGCSEGNYNEFGAMFASRFISKTIIKKMEYYNLDSISYLTILQETENELLHQMKDISLYFDNLYNGFMFTIIGFILHQGLIIVFSCGDGIYGYSTNNELKNIKIGPYPENKPPYLTYNMIDTATYNHIKILEIIDAVLYEKYNQTFEALYIASDGICDFLKLEGECFPGKPKTQICSIEEFWKNPEYEKDDKISLYLRKINLDRTKHENNKLIHNLGKLNDDTTIIIIKKMDNNDDSSCSK